MNRSFVVVLLVALLLLGSVAVSASEPKTIPNWASLRSDMELFKGALKTIGSDVMNTILPGYGVIFILQSYKKVEDVQLQIERALVYITPTIASLPVDERIAVVCYCLSYPGTELMYVSKAGTSANPETWDVYLNVAPE